MGRRAMHRASSSVVDSGVVAATVPVEAVAGTQAGSEMGSGSGLQRASGCYSGGRVVDVVDGISWDGVK